MPFLCDALTTHSRRGIHAGRPKPKKEKGPKVGKKSRSNCNIRRTRAGRVCINSHGNTQGSTGILKQKTTRLAPSYPYPHIHLHGLFSKHTTHPTAVILDIFDLSELCSRTSTPLPLPNPYPYPYHPSNVNQPQQPHQSYHPVITMHPHHAHYAYVYVLFCSVQLLICSSQYNITAYNPHLVRDY